MHHEFDKSSVVANGSARLVREALDEAGSLTIQTIFGPDLTAGLVACDRLDNFRTVLKRRFGAHQGIRGSQLAQMIEQLDASLSVLVVDSPGRLIVLGSPFQNDMDRPWSLLERQNSNVQYFYSSIKKFRRPLFTPAA